MKLKVDEYDFPVHDYTQEQNCAHTFLPSFDNENGRLCQERLFQVIWESIISQSPLSIILF